MDGGPQLNNGQQNNDPKEPGINLDEIPGIIINERSSSRKYSLGFFVLITVCFLMPFFRLSCGGTELIVVSGLETVTGTEYHQSEMLNNRTDNKKMDPEPFAALALLCALAGIGFSFTRTGFANLMNLIVSIGGTLFLLLLKFKLDNDVYSSGESILRIEYLFGYWFALILFIFSAMMHGLLVKRRY